MVEPHETALGFTDVLWFGGPIVIVCCVNEEEEVRSQTSKAEGQRLKGRIQRKVKRSNGRCGLLYREKMQTKAALTAGTIAIQLRPDYLVLKESIGERGKKRQKAKGYQFIFVHVKYVKSSTLDFIIMGPAPLHPTSSEEAGEQAISLGSSALRNANNIITTHHHTQHAV